VSARQRSSRQLAQRPLKTCAVKGARRTLYSLYHRYSVSTDSSAPINTLQLIAVYRMAATIALYAPPESF
jgi:hypothetical protein